MDSKRQTRKGPDAARLVIVDDHEIARSGLKRMLEDEPDLEVVGEATNGREALEVCLHLRPDLVLMDVQMPRKNGIVATRELTTECPDTSIIMMTIYESPKYLSEAMKAGAAGYVLKDAAKHQVVGAVRQTLRGEPLPAPALAARPSVERNERRVKPPPEHMTPRELEILHLLAQGKTNREIARNLVVSPGTVKVHVEHIISKLAVSDRTGAVVRAIELGLLPTSE